MQRHAAVPLASFRSRSNILAWILPPIKTSISIRQQLRGHELRLILDWEREVVLTSSLATALDQ